MLPWLNEPSNRRRPFIDRYRAAQITGVPTSAMKTASSAASSSIRRATSSGRTGVWLRSSTAKRSS
ncbi:Uncharacterised protein [Mycobacteroides abscessus subsp. abscessus]|nr:Uncharacterised protein [Mycobacteroides abscessus subsp. abscessus]